MPLSEKQLAAAEIATASPRVAIDGLISGDAPVRSGDSASAGDQGRDPVGGSGRESVAASGATFRARRLEVPGKGRDAAGRRSRAYTDSGATTDPTRAPVMGDRKIITPH